MQGLRPVPEPPAGSTPVPDAQPGRRGIPMDELGTAEFEALRRTIRERGTVRPVLAVATLGGWAALALWAATGAGIPAATLVPLVVLYAGFEAVAALHLGVERIGRYLQVEYEQTGASAGRAPRWETTAMAFGRTRASVAVDPLFSVAFLSALVLNLLPALGATPQEILALGAAHALVAIRMLRVRHHAARQRDDDLARFRELAAPRRSPLGEGDRQQ